MLQVWAHLIHAYDDKGGEEDSDLEGWMVDRGDDDDDDDEDHIEDGVKTEDGDGDKVKHVGFARFTVVITFLYPKVKTRQNLVSPSKQLQIYAIF